MPTLRLFAQARETAGTGKAEVSGSTVREVLEEAAAQFGEDFSEILSISNVWVNGEQAEASTAVGPADEVAVLPPVSGG